jgi:RNA polymerase sigma factor (sigma-70 family)
MEPSADQNAAFDDIVRRYYERILKFCCYALGGNRSAAEDCAQDIFLILYENMGKLKDYDKIGGWLYKTAGNLSKQHAATLRRERARFALPFAGSAFGDSEDPVENIAVENNAKTEAERIVEERNLARADGKIRQHLKPGDERVLELIREKLPLKEVAVRLNISLSAAKSRTSRLRQKIGALARELLAD